MIKKQLFHIDYFDGYYLLAIVTHLKDYRIAHFINRETGSQLVKYEDLRVGKSENDEFSLYRYHRKEDHVTLYLISNSNNIRKLIPSKKEVDYFLLIKDAVGQEVAENLAGKIRSIKNVMTVFKVDMATIRDMDMLLETIELHEIQQKQNKTKQK